MKTLTIVVAFITVVSFLSAQVPVKKDLMQMFEKIPAPPATAKDAFTKIIAGGGLASPKCSAEKLFSAIEKETKDFEAEYVAQAKAGPGSNAPGMSQENANKMNDPEMRKKMKKMTKEERMQMAAEMMKSMPTPGTAQAMDPPLIRAALDEWQLIYNDTQNEFQRSAAEQQEELKLVEEYMKSHAAIETWETAEIAKLPQISSGEMSAPDPAKVKQVKLKSAVKHIALADKRLEVIQSRWRASLDRAKTKYGTFHKKLVAADYAVDSKNFSTKKVLSDAQMTILKIVQHHIVLSRESWEESASWQAKRIRIEKS
ncbi:MAG TPA: hypothetical protein VI758_09130 [Bacteroidota bacterium]